MAQRPDVNALVTFMGLPPLGSGDDDLAEILGDDLAAALDDIESRLREGVIPAPDSSDVVDYPARVRTAVLMYANRLFKRRSSPEGVSGFGELGAVRVAPLDHDIEQLIGRLIRLDGFA